MIARKLEKAREAFLKRDVKAARAAHHEHGEEPHVDIGHYIKSVVYGGLDGIITTFAVVAGATGASLGSGVILILGFANLVADGLSMAAADFMSTKSEQEFRQREREREEWEVDVCPEEERKELVAIYMKKGMSKKDAAKLVGMLCKNKNVWIDTMMAEELGMVGDERDAGWHALATFLSFILFGLVPLLTFVVAFYVPMVLEYSFVAASVLNPSRISMTDL